MICLLNKRGWHGRLIRYVILVLILSGSGKACALKLELFDLAYGYSGCGWVDNGNGTSTIAVDVSYKQVTAATKPVGTRFLSRGILVYAYDKSGSLKPSSDLAQSVSMNGVSTTERYYGEGYVMYLSKPSATWTNMASFVAHYRVLVKNSTFSDWPAMALRAGNFTNGNDAGEKSGVAYIRYGESNGVCELVTNPEVPPPLDIKIDMTAPDWNLGELPRGDSEKTFPEVANQLCFTYSGPSVKGKCFIINASNANGVVGNRYRLKNMNDTSQTIPYDVALSGSSAFALPNEKNVALTMSDSGKTCFVPTFKTTVDNTVKEGDYSDVLTFTVITQP
ncbi:hypothetical protein [Burkholderia sp. 22PA0106]|uniref:hypothetical protein n=1 Tax=Burkholderia sp. 22PA0106 TaxID=3237371 RepID=UPI0039C2A2A4